MTRELKFFSAGPSEDPVEQMANEFRLVAAVNGHVPDDDEIKQELERDGLDVTEDNVAKVRELLKRKP